MKSKNATSTKQKGSIEILVRPGNQTQDLLQLSLMLYLSVTNTTELKDCSQAIQLLQCSNHKQTKPNLLAKCFQQSRFMHNILTCMDNYIWQFLVFMKI